MRIYFKYLLLFSIVFHLIGCQPSGYFKTKNTSNPINDSYANNVQIDSLIHPYKTKLDAEMNEVLVISSEEFPKEKGKPETKLGNLVADLSLKVANELYKPTDRNSIDFCLLNFGGLRTSLPKGEITRGKIFELMPFENELVVVTINKYNFNKLVGYINKAKGEPIAGDLKLVFKDSLINITLDTKTAYKDGVKVLTSDYLANGGDNMSFFLNPIAYEPVGIKLRDAIIQYCIEQNKKGNQLVGKLDGRITFE